MPVLKFTDNMTLTQIGAAVKELAGKARNKKLTPAEMEGSTFTVSNLGMFGVDVFTSIINQPNSAILSVGAIIEKPVVKNGQIVVGHTMPSNPCVRPPYYRRCYRCSVLTNTEIIY